MYLGHNESLAAENSACLFICILVENKFCFYSLLFALHAILRPGYYWLTDFTVSVSLSIESFFVPFLPNFLWDNEDNLNLEYRTFENSRVIPAFLQAHFILKSALNLPCLSCTVPKHMSLSNIHRRVEHAPRRCVLQHNKPSKCGGKSKLKSLWEEWVIYLSLPSCV